MRAKEKALRDRYGNGAETWSADEEDCKDWVLGDEIGNNA